MSKGIRPLPLPGEHTLKSITSYGSPIKKCYQLNLKLRRLRLEGSTAVYDAVGDVRGYHLVRQHFAALAGAVAGHSGAVVKTIGDEVIAAFADPVDAISASIDIARKVEEMNRSHSDRLRLKMGFHGGHCLLVTLNNQIISGRR
jgi:hypothetical protein